MIAIDNRATNLYREKIMMSKRQRMIFLGLLVTILVSVLAFGAGSKARRPAILAGADQVVNLQRIDAGWEGTWYWYVGSTYNATNLTGATALGLIEAFRDIKDPIYLNASMAAAEFIQTHLGAGATGIQHHVRTTAADVVFLHRLSEVTGDQAYADRAVLEWNNLKSFWPNAADLDALFRAINRRSAWDIAFFLEAAYLSGDMVWADDAAAILSDISDTFYYGTDTWWYALNLSASVRALVGCGYFQLYPDNIADLLYSLIPLIDDVNGVGGWIQDAAYAVMALNTVGGAARGYANTLAKWLAQNQEADGGWLEEGYEYPEVNGEAVRALSATIGTNITLDGFEPGILKKSAFNRADASMKAEPFQGD